MTNPEIIAITISIGGLIVAALAYRRAGNLKKLDQIVEVGRSQNGLQESYNSLTTMHGSALDHRKKVMAAIGKFKSGDMQRMENEWNAGADAIAALEKEVANGSRSPNSMSPSNLAALLVEIDGVKRSVDLLVGRYAEWDNWDKQQQQRIREERLEQFRAGRTSSPS